MDRDTAAFRNYLGAASNLCLGGPHQSVRVAQRRSSERGAANTLNWSSRTATSGLELPDSANDQAGDSGHRQRRQWGSVDGCLSNPPEGLSGSAFCFGVNRWADWGCPTPSGMTDEIDP